MNAEIIAKIRTLLADAPIAEEARCVYMLTEIRKVFEREGSLGARMPTLQFYCNWALHTRLDKKQAQKFLNAVLPILTLQGNHTPAEHAKFDRLLTLQAFREEMRAFLAHNSIDTSLCDSAVFWGAFLKAYSRIVENCDLVFTGLTRGAGPLNLAVKSVSIRAAHDVALAGNRPYPMDWTIKYADGREGHLALSSHGLAGATLQI